LNFNRKGSTYKSVLGGSFTLLVKTLIFVYFASLVISLVTHEKDYYSSHKHKLDVEKLGEVKFTDTKIHPIIVVYNWKLNKYLEKIDYEKYFKIILGQRTSNCKNG